MAGGDEFSSFVAAVKMILLWQSKNWCSSNNFVFHTCTHTRTQPTTTATPNKITTTMDEMENAFVERGATRYTFFQGVSSSRIHLRIFIFLYCWTN